MKLLVLSAEDLRAALPMMDVVAAMKKAFGAFSAGETSTPQRGVVDAPRGTTLLMGASIPELGLAAKVVSVFPGNTKIGRPVLSGLAVALDRETGEPAALCDGTYLTALRTGGATGAATDLLAREEARVAALIGLGSQGRLQALGIDSVRDFETIRVFDPRPRAREEFCRELSGVVNARLVPTDSAREAVDGADVVCAATTSETPVFDGNDLTEGCHVNGVGSYQLTMREVDGETVGRARVFVDSIEAALAEAGDLVSAEAEGRTRREDWVEIGDVARGRSEGRRDETEITLFKSVGLAVQDVAAASLALDEARHRGLGTTIEI